MRDLWARLIELERRQFRFNYEIGATQNELRSVESQIADLAKQTPRQILRPVIGAGCFTWADTLCLRLNWYEHQPATAGVNVQMNSGSSGGVWFRNGPTSNIGPFSHATVSTLPGTTFSLFSYLTLPKIEESETEAEYAATADTYSYFIRLSKADGNLVVFGWIINKIGPGYGGQNWFIIDIPALPIGNQPTPGIPGLTGSATPTTAFTKLRNIPAFGPYTEFGTGDASVTISWGTTCGLAEPVTGIGVSDGGTVADIDDITDISDGGTFEDVPTDISDGGTVVLAFGGVSDGGSPDDEIADTSDGGTLEDFDDITDISDGGGF